MDSQDVAFQQLNMDPEGGATMVKTTYIVVGIIGVAAASGIVAGVTYAIGWWGNSVISSASSAR